jgi:hypothetical protein
MFIISNGCSHTFTSQSNNYLSYLQDFIGNSITLDYISATSYLFGGEKQELSVFDERQEESWVNLNNFGKVIQPDNFSIINKLETTNNGIISLSFDGKSNQTIFLETIEYINRCISVDSKPDYVIVQWSGPSRNLQCIPNSYTTYEWVEVTPHDNTENGVLMEPLASLQTLMYIYNLQTFLKSNDIKYTFLCYMELDSSVTKLDTFNSIDLNNFISYETSHPILKGFLNDFKEIGWTKDKPGHPDTVASKYISIKIMEHINPNFKENILI